VDRAAAAAEKVVAGEAVGGERRVDLGERLGPELLADPRANLYAHDCQTWPPSWRRSSLAVQAEGDLAAVSLHHTGYRAPALDDTVTIAGRRFESDEHPDLPHSER
jgi:hypothetical protein